MADDGGLARLHCHLQHFKRRLGGRQRGSGMICFTNRRAPGRNDEIGQFGEIGEAIRDCSMIVGYAAAIDDRQTRLARKRK